MTTRPETATPGPMITTDTDMKHDYSPTLRDLQDELDGMDQRRSDLEAAIEALKRLVPTESQPTNGNKAHASNGHKPKIAVPRGFFAGKTPTQAYRDFIRLWPGEYRPPEIADAFIAGGLDKSRSDLVQAIHSVLKREKKKQLKGKQPDLDFES